MNPNNQHRFYTKSFCKKHILKTTKHNTISKQQMKGENAKEQTKNEHKKIDLDVVIKEPHKSGEIATFPGIFINTKRIAIGNIVFSHCHVIFTKHSFYKFIITHRGYDTHGTTNRKNDKGEE